MGNLKSTPSVRQRVKTPKKTPKLWKEDVIVGVKQKFELVHNSSLYGRDPATAMAKPCSATATGGGSGVLWRPSLVPRRSTAIVATMHAIDYPSSSKLVFKPKHSKYFFLPTKNGIQAGSF